MSCKPGSDQELAIPFRGPDQCGPCGIVCDSFPEDTWDDVVEKYTSRTKRFVDLWDKCRDVAEKGVSAFLPKPVRSAVRIGVEFSMVFLFLPIMLFNTFFEDVVLKEVKRLRTVTLFDFQNEKREGILLKPTTKGRSMNLPEVRCWRDSVLYIEEDLCPAMQIREKQSSEVFAYQSKKRLKGRSHLMKDIAMKKAPTFERVAKECRRWRKLQTAKTQSGELPIEVDSDEPRAEHRKLVDADVAGEAPAPKRTGKKKRQRDEKAKEIVKRFKSALGSTRPRTTKSEPDSTGLVGATVLAANPETLAAKSGSDTDGSGAIPEDDLLSGSEGEVQQSSKLDVEALLRCVVPMGNKEQGVTTLVFFVNKIRCTGRGHIIRQWNGFVIHVLFAAIQQLS